MVMVTSNRLQIISGHLSPPLHRLRAMELAHASKPTARVDVEDKAAGRQRGPESAGGDRTVLSSAVRRQSAEAIMG